MQLLFAVESASAFENLEHQYVSNLALNGATTNDNAPDIALYHDLILSWTFGINYKGFLCGKPAEQLAHIQDQSKPLKYTAAIDGGDFETIRQNIFDQYKAFNFNNENPTTEKEGAYVWLGAAMHLIEDQASLPHAANVWHSAPDNFEGPLTYADILTCDNTGKTGGRLSKSPYASVGADQAYSNSLGATQAAILSGSMQCPISSTQTAPCYLFNDQLYPGTPRYQGLKNQQATVDPTGTPLYDFSLFGDYGGSLQPTFPTTNRMDIYSDAALPGVFAAQGTQAADFAYYFLLNTSISLPPLIKNLQSSTQFPGPNNPMTITFYAMDNHTPTVAFTAFILNSDGTDTGEKAFDGKSLPPLQTGSVLPFENDESLSWNGTPTDGSTLDPGSYQLCGVLTDADNNSFPASGDDTTGTCQSFPTTPLPFLVERRDNAVIRGEALSGLKFRMERRAYRQAGT